ncbi:hypothetical protein A1O1_08058 [Capronia coronata CBS 617.96]|uniref:Protein root UVB sensitive/RUS domain-containing protein n=1 Tax=Capronia coronata CBS 617.96 TaxID=1182541 RepID=W9XXA4_9EURO|nr:uncharacterized protein A1O1_08058 [Capronia coronata CBS 617.96]EXJ81990.1 hypothetical protein A1O1_08058 [Capronia coronata CBS 617.96]
MEIEELAADGRPKAIFSLDIPAGKLRISSPPTVTSPQTGFSWLNRCLSPFLPAGYPSTVTPDYTPYQIYNSLQAFASTIAGLLASRAVFVGMGVGSEDASLVTTMLLHIAQETIGRVATIVFAHRFSQRIEAEVKFYRFFADIVNDTAFMLDCMSPAMSTLGRVITLCVSNACRAVCGVAGGSSKAILCSHFAKAGNIGELSAKGGSQETMVSLMGMWVGGVLVSKVHGTVATWSCLIPLLVFHLWANWKAVRSVCLSSLNTDRALIFFRGVLEGQVKDAQQVGAEETILGRRTVSCGLRGLYLTRFRVGVGVNDLVACMYGRADHESRNLHDLIDLFHIFGEEEYVLWFDVDKREALILLKDTATGPTQARSICHLLRCLRTQATTASAAEAHGREQGSRPIKRAIEPSERLHDSQQRLSMSTDGYHRSIQLLLDTLHENREQWSRIRDQAEEVGWDLGLTDLVKGQGARIRLNDEEVKKVQ